MKHTFGIYLAHPDAIMPLKAHSSDAGFDLHTIEDIHLMPGERKLVHTGLHIQLEVGWEAQIRPRSGNAYKLGLTVLNTPGTIDATYTGELMVLLINNSMTPIELPKKSRIAQMVIKEVPNVELTQIDKKPENNERGDGGYGHTGSDHKFVKQKK